MTGIALACRRNMLRRLGQRPRPVVAIRTSAGGGRNGRGVIECIGKPIDRRRMAFVALFRGGHVIWPFGLGIRSDKTAVVTGIALPCRSGMAHGRRRECRRCLMAGFARGSGRNMGDRLALAVCTAVDTIVASAANHGTDRIVVHAGRLPCHGGMAVFAGSGACRNVPDRFARRPSPRPGMAGRTSARRPAEGSRRVTRLAGHGPVRIFKNEAGLCMVERQIRPASGTGRLRKRPRACRQQDDKAKRNPSEKPVQNVHVTPQKQLSGKISHATWIF